MQNKIVSYKDCRIIDYKEAWDIQLELFEKIKQLKLYNRDISAEFQKVTPNYLLFCEHNHVYTLGKSGEEQNLLVSQDELSSEKIKYYHINRGGDITYHGPGQLTGYPIFDLYNFKTDLLSYLRDLEEVIILTVAEFGIKAGRVEGLTGVWVDFDNLGKARKICAMGIHMSRWATMHGFGLNVTTDLSYFDKIIPCGILDKGVTSIEKEIGNVNIEDVKLVCKEKLKKVFMLEKYDDLDLSF